MENNEVRKGVTNASFNEENANFLFGEIAIVSVVSGIMTNSWWVGGACLLFLLIGLFFKTIATVILVSLSLAWGWISYSIGNYFWGFDAGIVIAILAVLVSGGMHLSALEWARDIGE
ncbi:hypothetical protein KFE80_03520 [bacterium SCSIO 12696]|nr:hypothetical protein KFE80_03520 [bacterium SCSIO 12696]